MPAIDLEEFFLTSLFIFSDGASRATFNESGEAMTWTGVTGDATLAWNPHETTTMYVKYARGMKGRRMAISVIPLILMAPAQRNHKD